MQRGSHWKKHFILLDEKNLLLIWLLKYLECRWQTRKLTIGIRPALALWFFGLQITLGKLWCLLIWRLEKLSFYPREYMSQATLFCTHRLHKRFLQSWFNVIKTSDDLLLKCKFSQSTHEMNHDLILIFREGASKQILVGLGQIGKKMPPCSGIAVFLPFHPATPLSRSWTREGLFELTWCPSMALGLNAEVASRI